MRIATVVTVLSFLALAGSVHADILILQDGRIVEGPKMEKVEGGVLVHFENGDVVVPTRMIEIAAIEGDTTPPEPKTPEEKEKYAKGLVPFDGKWMKPAKREKAIQKKIASKKAYLAEIRAHQLWRDRYKVKTKHFLFEYTVPPHIADYYGGLMDAYFKEFSKIWKIKKEKDYYPLKVCFYTNPSDFHQISGAPGGALAYFKFVKPVELNFFFDRLEPRFTEEVLYHEVSHYLQKLIKTDFSMPHWPGEALAEYYGASHYDAKKKKLTVGLIQEGRLSGIKTTIAGGDRWELEKLVTAPRGTIEHYSWGWTLVHYLMSKKKTSKKFSAFVIALAYGRDVKRVAQGYETLKTVTPKEVWRVFKSYMGLKNETAVNELQQGWWDYIDNDLKIESARGLEKAARDAVRTGRTIRAKRLFTEAIEKGTENPLTYHRFAELLSRESDKGKAIKMWRKAIKLDPLVADFYESLGEALHRADETRAEGVKLLKLALELDPDDYWLEYRIKEILED